MIWDRLAEKCLRVGFGKNGQGSIPHSASNVTEAQNLLKV
jgi:hypothetical protein